METGNSSAGYGYEKDREHVSELLICEACVHRKVHVRMRNNNTDNSAEDHSCKHECCHVVTRLL